MSYLSSEEFSQPERQGKLGTILWPDWHYGVLLLYGQNLALNHLIASNQMNIVKLEGQLDYPSHFILQQIFFQYYIYMYFISLMIYFQSFNDINKNNEKKHIYKYYSLKMASEGNQLSENK